ncbi:class I SAM-dependent methyltransferase [Candidatus Venteria ishoeyi]|uniref:class I SAM-dependent methyltransferase n=1 Tax=Candidatus Venteria ishoeyi TaxID=1899563 RepID=UPI0025A6642A|nr:class I SAM-dependent methyltransferase [Candidatus Venteria ishoeyi]MDM8545345.1 class I SAM-dependent methyltransferase [Candidatus Venteria ishoeyi]
MDRKQHWEQVYAEKNAKEVSWYQAHPEISLELIKTSQQKKGIIDVGGGASVLIDKLLESAYQDLAVLDISAAALRIAQQRLGQNATQIQWIESDVTQFKATEQFNLWHDRAVFHFLTEKSDRAAYLQVLRNSLKPGGCVIMAAFAIAGPEKCSGLDIVQYDAEKLLKELNGQHAGKFTLQEQVSENHKTPTGKIQAFTYYRMQRTA